MANLFTKKIDDDDNTKEEGKVTNMFGKIVKDNKNQTSCTSTTQSNFKMVFFFYIKLKKIDCYKELKRLKPENSMQHGELSPYKDVIWTEENDHSENINLRIRYDKDKCVYFCDTPPVETFLPELQKLMKGFFTPITDIFMDIVRTVWFKIWSDEEKKWGYFKGIYFFFIKINKMNFGIKGPSKEYFMTIDGKKFCEDFRNGHS